MKKKANDFEHYYYYSVNYLTKGFGINYISRIGRDLMYGSKLFAVNAQTPSSVRMLTAGVTRRLAFIEIR